MGRIWLGLFGLMGLAALVWTGAWHGITLHLVRQPMLSWLPILVGLLVGVLVAAVLRRGRRIHWGAALLTTGLLLLVGAFQTLFFKSNSMLDHFTHGTIAALPATTQPRLLPKAGIVDDPQFARSHEIHLARDPASGELVWTGEWLSSFFSGGSRGVAVKRLDDIEGAATVLPKGFAHSVSGHGPGTIKWDAKLRHPFSRIQYPVLIPTGDGAEAILPYMGYQGFPFPSPYLKGVLVYHSDGRIEDLSPAQAAQRPELLRSGRVIPEVLARKEAEAIARSEIDGHIDDGHGNKQPFLTALDPNHTDWVTIVNDSGGDKVKGVVLTDSTTGKTDVWRPNSDTNMISTRRVLDQAESLPLRWKETRCCDSDGHSYTVTLREVVEPRLAFKDGHPYYMVTVVPTRELSLPRQVEYTLLIDAQTGERIDMFRHVERGREEDSRLQKFFKS